MILKYIFQDEYLPVKFSLWYPLFCFQMVSSSENFESVEHHLSGLGEDWFV